MKISKGLDLGFVITKIDDGRYQMEITKEYSTGNKQELITKIDEDLQKLVSEFEKMKNKEVER